MQIKINHSDDLHINLDFFLKNLLTSDILFQLSYNVYHYVYTYSSRKRIIEQVSEDGKSVLTSV